MRACVELILAATIKSICIRPYAAAGWTDSRTYTEGAGCFCGRKAASTPTAANYDPAI